ncbi:MAG: hypothetical protein ACU841_08480 [Gammaproteobacteria bacterium]
MKKLLYITTLMAITLLYTSVSHADGRGWKHGRGHHRHHHHGHHHHHYYPRPRVRYYYPAPEVYYPAPPVAYVPAPPPAYYPPAPVYPNYYNQKSSQGLAGGVIGSVFGYEIGNGDPIAAGLGAAAGSYLGNGIARRY